MFSRLFQAAWEKTQPLSVKEFIARIHENVRQEGSFSVLGEVDFKIEEHTAIFIKTWNNNSTLLHSV